MSMSIHVKGIREADDEFRKMVAAKKACDEAGVDPPQEVEDFLCEFTNEDIAQGFMEIKIPHNEWKDNYRWGFEVELAQIPANVKKVRFYCST